MSQVVPLTLHMDLSVVALQAAMEQYKATFTDSPCNLVVGDGNYFLAQEILHGGGRIRLEVAGWMPPNVWMLTGTQRQGIIYSGAY